MTPQIEQTVVLGAGALGAFYASKFYEMDKTRVSFIASGERYERLKAEGVFINGSHYSIPVIKPQDDLPPPGLIIVALKHHQLKDAVKEIEPVVGPDTLFLSVMNGIESEETIGSIYGMERVLYCIALGIDGLREGNRVTCTKQGELLFGEAQNHILSERVKGLQNLFDRANLVHRTPEDMIRVLWWKFMINVGINQASAVLGAPFGVFHASKDACDIMEAAMREAMTIAGRRNIQLTGEDIDNWRAILSGLNPKGKTSMLQDIEAGRKTEVEMFAGKVVEMGGSYGIPTPVNWTLLKIIRVMESGLSGASV
jgi:2-dehydropantoate 2-reductase